MSGGHFDYRDQGFCEELFDDYPYRDNTFNMSNKMALKGPFKDIELNEQLWDMFCLLHEYDWYRSGDTSVEDWEEARKIYKKKWFGEGTSDKERANRIMEVLTENFAHIVEHTLGGEPEEKYEN